MNRLCPLFKSVGVMLLAAPLFTGCDFFHISSIANLEYRTLEAAGHTWSYAIYSPTTPNALSTPQALVLVLHGTGGNGPDALAQNHWLEKSDAAGFVVVAPTGLPDRPGEPPDFFTNPTSWNAGPGWHESPRQQIDDLVFFDALLTEVRQTRLIDPRRIFVAGHSNGGAMAFRLATHFADTFAAVAVAASPCWETDPRPARPIPTLLIAGTADPIAPFDGGESSTPWGHRLNPSVAETIKIWSAALGCLPDPISSDIAGPLTTINYGRSPDTPIFTVIEITGHGHGWPGAAYPGLSAIGLGPITDALSATDAAWNFFVAHRIPEQHQAAARSPSR